MWDVIKDWVFDVIQFFYNGVGDWVMAIIIITIIFRVIVAPLVHKSSAEEQQGSESETPDAHDVRHYVAVHALDFLVRSRRRAFVLGRFFDLRGYSAAAYYAFPEEEGR